MTASSQNPRDPERPEELPPVRPLSDAERAAYAAYDAATPAPAGPAVPTAGPKMPAPYPDHVPFHLRVPSPEPQSPECAVCSGTEGGLLPDPDKRQYPSGALVQFCLNHLPLSFAESAAERLIKTARERGDSSRMEALALSGAGMLFDPQRAEDIAQAAAEQAHADDKAALAQAAQDRQAREWFRDRQRAVGQLCEGRPLDYYVAVGEVLAALDGRTATTAPLTITWDGIVMGPSGDTEGENTLIPCTTARGGRAALVVDDEKRQELGEQLLASVHAAEACTTVGCGKSEAELDVFGDESAPDLRGWILVQVHGAGGPARWWCSALCAQAAITAGGAELAAADRAAAVDPDQQAPSAPAPATGRGTDDWPPNGGHGPLCAYASGISRTCTCPEATASEADPSGGAL